ncbi:Astacin like protein [Argiope bruennichi]|uniref:Metalloendopeptidase n=1 Tax=Argiope bruennichi TaxID=94029 RepID=A0A8T0EAB6_ARGBR|nr:Astacin like protein [Argiope bruennichi]
MGTAMLISFLLFCIIFEVVYSSVEFLNLTYVEPEYLENLLTTGQYEEFARLLQIDDVNLVKPAEGLEGGDILLRPWQREQARQGVIWASSDNSKWKKVVPYVIDRKGYTAAERAAILKAIVKWNRDMFWYIRFRPRVFDKDYVMFFNGTGCYSNLGKVGGQQPISLRANGCLTEGTILHEMAHTVGIIHEHDRPDRDKYIKILPQNIPKEWQSQYEKSSYQDVQILGPYDYYSVMHYPIPAPHTHLPSPLSPPQKKGSTPKRIGQREEQTQIDKDKIKRLYS